MSAQFRPFTRELPPNPRITARWKLLGILEPISYRLPEAPQGVTLEFRERLARQAIDVRSLAPGEFSAFLRTEIEKWGKVVRTVGTKPD